MYSTKEIKAQFRQALTTRDFTMLDQIVRQLENQFKRTGKSGPLYLRDIFVNIFVGITNNFIYDYRDRCFLEFKKLADGNHLEVSLSLSGRARISEHLRYNLGRDHAVTHVLYFLLFDLLDHELCNGWDYVTSGQLSPVNSGFRLAARFNSIPHDSIVFSDNTYQNDQGMIIPDYENNQETDFYYIPGEGDVFNTYRALTIDGKIIANKA
jgi:hypothetical protein